MEIEGDMFPAGDFAPLEETAGTTEEDRRHEARRQTAVVLDAFLVDVPNRPQVRVTTVDTSTSGMQFLSRRAFAAGERVAVKMEFRNRTGKLVLCVVRHCTPADGTDHRVGVEFIEAVTVAPGKTVIPLRWSARP
jgi:hypothetical protein